MHLKPGGKIKHMWRCYPLNEVYVTVGLYVIYKHKIQCEYSFIMVHSHKVTPIHITNQTMTIPHLQGLPLTLYFGLKEFLHNHEDEFRIRTPQWQLSTMKWEPLCTHLCSFIAGTCADSPLSLLVVCQFIVEIISCIICNFFPFLTFLPFCLGFTCIKFSNI